MEMATSVESDSRDAYGFAVPHQHLQRYREHAKIYKEEEEERSQRWKVFLERMTEPDDESEESFSKGKSSRRSVERENHHKQHVDKREGSEKGVGREDHDISHSFGAIELMMSYRVKRKMSPYTEQNFRIREHLASIDVASHMEGLPKEEDSDEEIYDLDRADVAKVGPSKNIEVASMSRDHAFSGLSFLWKEELESLVHGGLPMDLRRELWQAFVGVRIRKVDGYYQSLLAPKVSWVEKWKEQIEKDLPRTFPDHPALDAVGRNALRRVLIAYAQHNPSVGYCQAMNFFAGLLLLLMPEENAFWTLLGIMDDFFEGYYSEEMIESQVDQLVFKYIVRERLPKLVSHLDYLGVQVAWFTGPWFLSIFVNILPWESVFRVWDVLLFEGNRVMLFRTALVLMELYGPALMTTKDAGDAVTLLQSLVGSTFDSSQLVLTACTGYRTVSDVKLQELRDKFRPEVIDVMEKRSAGLKDSKDLASKLYSFKLDPASLLPGTKSTEESYDTHEDESDPESLKGFCNENTELELNEQVKRLKVELCKLVKEKRTAFLRAEELETAVVEMVKGDNRSFLRAKVEHLEQMVSELRQALLDKQEQERAMIQALMEVEQEQKFAEDARISAEKDAAAKKNLAHVLQEKYKDTMNLLAEMEKRAVMAETMLEATLQYQSGQGKAHQQTPQSPLTQLTNRDSSPVKRGILSRPFVLGWRDKNKCKQKDEEDSSKQNTSTDPTDIDVDETSARVE